VKDEIADYKVVKLESVKTQTQWGEADATDPFHHGLCSEGRQKPKSKRAHHEVQ